MTHELETDYLVVGAGAMGMAFVDEIVSGSHDAHVTLVDRRSKPGGHWNDAYRFVTLHQPAAYYGVNSEQLGAGGDDMASGAEITAYYERVLARLCATGRVTFFPQCDYQGQGRFRSILSEQDYRVTVRRRTVDATWSRVEVPSTRPPAYPAAPSIGLVPINDLARLDRNWERYVVIGAGKTGLDALLYLLGRGVPPEQLTWIISHDVWMLNRRLTMPRFAHHDLPRQLRCLARVEDLDDCYRQFEAEGWVFRLDPDIWPTRFRCATVTAEELETLRGLPNVVRMGRVVRIDPTEIVLERGTIPTHDNVLHVDCTACGLLRRPSRPVFDGST
ncbi:MAG: NAD(P)-binding protein, partial [Myxococcota bacterium]|nr:NAD(P)-binding protein [Myxococcota bacterium]